MLSIMAVAQRNRLVGPLGGSIYLGKTILADDVTVPDGFHGLVIGDMEVPDDVVLDNTGDGDIINVT